MRPIEHIRRRFLKITQAEMAAVAGVSQATVSRWESGRLKIDGESMARVRDRAHGEVGWNDALFFSVPDSVEYPPGSGP